MDRDWPAKVQLGPRSNVWNPKVRNDEAISAELRSATKTLKRWTWIANHTPVSAPEPVRQFLIRRIQSSLDRGDHLSGLIDEALFGETPINWLNEPYDGSRF